MISTTQPTQGRVGQRVVYLQIGSLGVELIEEEPYYFLGGIEILGVMHHVEAIGVCQRNGIQAGYVPAAEEIGEPVGFNDQRIDDLAYFTHGRLQTVELCPDEEYVLIVTPHCE